MRSTSRLPRSALTIRLPFASRSASGLDGRLAQVVELPAHRGIRVARVEHAASARVASRRRTEPSFTTDRVLEQRV